ncbi:hypothetical protein C5T95_29450 [Raoultella ornithinolytica]|uniref:ead/Ea22-like family protein n=2 Tax=Raoultella ornithinolytica TaxID=54291 RepID=UPI000CF32A19|nr:ead/Ea22-like family protein [Raoultella ornithinolytica]PQH17349.1 hypothetical protein C5T95_29450 [Raoultella ornithinolytica]
MTTDITELAQRLKAAAEKATPGNWRYLKTTPFMDAEISAANHARVVNLLAGDVTEANSAFIALANPANILALVEALEKAQAQSSKWLEAYHKAVKIGARYEERIADLESRTVKLPPCVDDLHGIGMVMSADAVVEALTSYGIKVEAE